LFNSVQDQLRILPFAQLSEHAMPMPLHLLKRATSAGWVCLMVAGCAAGGDAPRESSPVVANGPLATLWLTTGDKTQLLRAPVSALWQRSAAGAQHRR
jgi:hypothetical protein